MALFDRSYMTYYLSCTVLSYLVLNNIVTLKSDKLVEKIVKHDSWPIQPDIFNPPLLWLTSRKPLWLDSSSRMHIMNHNWSATKQHLHPQSVAEISRHSVLSGDRIRQCETSDQTLAGLATCVGGWPSLDGLTSSVHNQAPRSTHPEPALCGQAGMSTRQKLGQ